MDNMYWARATGRFGAVDTKRSRAIAEKLLDKLNVVYDSEALYKP